MCSLEKNFTKYRLNKFETLSPWNEKIIIRTIVCTNFCRRVCVRWTRGRRQPSFEGYVEISHPYISVD